MSYILLCWYILTEIKIILLITTSISVKSKWELLPGCHVFVLFFSGMEESFGTKIPYICNIIGNQRIVLRDYEIFSGGGRDWKTSLTQRNIMYCPLPMRVSLDLPPPNLLKILTRPPITQGRGHSLSWLLFIVGHHPLLCEPGCAHIILLTNKLKVKKSVAALFIVDNL